MARNTAPRILAALLCALLLSPLAVDAAQKKNKGKKGKGGKQDQGQQQPPAGQGQSAPPPPAAPPAAVGTVDRRLWEFKTSEARSAVNPIADQAASNAYVAMALGRVLEQEKKYGEAESQLRKAVELAPSDPAAQVWLGEVYLRQRNQGAADGAFRRAAELAEARGDNYHLGVARQRLRQYDQAVSALERAGSAGALAPYQIGVTRLFQEQWQPALDQLTRAIEMDSGLAYAYYHRGLAAEKLNRKDLLVNDMERFLQLAPNAPEAERAKAILRAVKR